MGEKKFILFWNFIFNDFLEIKWIKKWRWYAEKPWLVSTIEDETGELSYYVVRNTKIKTLSMYKTRFFMQE